jgi:hypothetical protein
MEEHCDGVDEDCDGMIDENYDEDGDGVASCDGDCDDADPANTPGAPERCDGRDNNCNGQEDEGWDVDGDGYSFCEGDCDDANAQVHPGLEEACDGVDNDCNPQTSEDGDLDGDGFTYCGGDCNDLQATVYPGATEVCDDLDNDCNSEVDERWECYNCSVSTPYVVCSDSVTWEKAREICGYFGADLVILEDAVENDAVSRYQYGVVGSAAWIGLTDVDSEGNFVWVDGSSGFTSWYSGEPNNSGGEDCAATNFGAIAQWNDYPCSYLLPFICE